jgi:hypothetical protein
MRASIAGHQQISMMVGGRLGLAQAIEHAA